MDQERRQHVRITFHTPAQLVFPDKTFEVAVIDLSLKGALLRLPTGEVVHGGANCLLHVQLNEGSLPEQISMEGRVTHSEGVQIGIVCVAIDLDSVTHLRRLVELNLGDPALLERELTALIAEQLEPNR